MTLPQPLLLLPFLQVLKHEVAEMKKKEVQHEKMMFEIAQENKRLSEPLDKAAKEESYLDRELENYEPDKKELKEVKMKILVTDEEFAQGSQLWDGWMKLVPSGQGHCNHAH